MKPQNNFGGPKASMLKGDSKSLPVKDTKGYSKENLYQLGKENKKLVLARLVELSDWLSDLAIERKRERKSMIDFLSASNIKIPRDAQGAQRHILVNPKGIGIDRDQPLVGVDEEIYLQIPSMNIEEVTFHVHVAGYDRVERWSIPVEEFLANSIPVNPKGLFVKQFMVPIAILHKYANN